MFDLETFLSKYTTVSTFIILTYTKRLKKKNRTYHLYRAQMMSLIHFIAFKVVTIITYKRDKQTRNYNNKR